MPAYLCSICQDYHSLENLRCLPCGHTYGEACIKRWINSRIPYNCPTCRRKVRSEPFTIYLDTGDPESQAGPAGEHASPPCHSALVHKQIQRATEELKRVEHDLRRQTVQKAAQELDKVAELSANKQECLLNLITAVTSRWRGMLPMISEFAEQRNQIIALKDKLRVTELARDQAVAETAKAEDIATNAVQTLEQVHKALAAAKAAACGMQERMEVLREAHKRELDGKQKDLSRLHDTLKALKEKEAKQKQEIERLREEAKASAALLHERAASLWNSLAEEDLGTDSGELHAQGLHNETFEPKFSQLEGSQATIERVSSTMSRKRKGSEDELVVLGEDAYEPLEHDVNHGRPRTSPKRRLVESKPSILSAPRFPSDWQLEGANASQKRAISGERPHVPLALDRKGKPLKPVQCASRTKFHRNS